MGMRKAAIFFNRAATELLLGARGGLRHSRRSRLTLVLVGASSLALWVSPAGAAELISVAVNGRAGNNQSSGVVSNIDGSSVAFYSDASNLVTGDTNGVRDVFVREPGSGTTERVSVSSAGDQANGASQAAGGAPGISADGQIVAFYSDATNLVAGDTNGKSDVFVRLRAADTTELVSIATDGTQGNASSGGAVVSISADGRFVAFQSQASNLVPDDTNGVSDIFVRDRVDGTTERVCGVQGNGASSTPSISADGNFVAFTSAATNLVADDTNRSLDVFVCDRSSNVIERVSVNSSGVQGNGDSILPAINANGTVVAFKSIATNLVPNDTNGVVDVFARDRTAGTTERISVNLTGGNANDLSYPPSISDDGRFVAFGSAATNLVVSDTNDSSNVFVRDRQIAVTFLADVNALGRQANSGTPDIPPGISGDGMQLGFVSFASNLAPGDMNDAADVYETINPFFGPGKCPDGVCPPGEGCVQGVCIPFTPTPTETKTVPPTNTPTVTPTPTLTPTFKPCTDDSMCPPGEHCRAGFCKKERPCETHEMCFDREACVGDLCECGGDCNLDGIVAGNEITTAVLILGGVAPLSQCEAADIDGDGSVMGNEITAAVLNLGLGCAQEGQPLLFGRDRGGMVTLTVGSATSASGDTAVISVDLSGGNGEVATAQLDLLFDPAVLDIGEPAVSCAKDPRLTTHIFFATLPDTPPAPPGLRRLRLFVGDTTAPIATFDDGRIATCKFQVKSDAGAVETTLAADRLNVGDATASVFGAQAVSGGVSILLPTPTPVPVPTPKPFCPGDCDGDGEVFGSEITQTVLIMAGEAPLTSCAAADADGDGEVFVTDITRAVISLGRGCPR